MSTVTEPYQKAAPRRALADISYNSLLADTGTSSEDESTALDLEPEDDVRGAIGVSIGREQTRLLSPRTPAVEKAAALQPAGYFGGAFDHDASGIAESPDEIDPLDGRKDSHPASTATTSRRPSLRPPSPWRSGTGHTEKDRSSFAKSILRDGFSFGRRRAASGPESRPKSFLSGLSSIPKNFSFSSTFLNGNDSNKEVDRITRRTSFSKRRRSFSKRRSTLGSQTPIKTPEGEEQEAATPSERPMTAAPTASRTDLDEEQAKIGELPSDFHLRHVRSRPAPLLRKSTSDTSLVTQRTLSTVSSLGDDSRFEHVSEQVNSRFKAIKDSLQDSRINMPSMPSISSFTVSNFTPDFLNRERSNSSFAKSRISSVQQTKSAGKPIEPPMTRQSNASVADAGLAKFAASHPHLHHALEHLEGDVVVLGGYRGSILRSAEPPHRQLWVPIKVGLNLRKVDLELGLEDADGEERAAEKVIAGGMLTHIGPIDISRRLFKRLRACNNARNGWLRVHDYGYDWRLSPSYLSRQLIKFLEGLECNQPGVPKELRGATVIAHSLGGLITRHAVNLRPDLFRGVVYAGVPHTCVNILGPLRNGDEVLLSSRVLTAQVNFTIRTSFALLPLDGRCFVDKYTKEEYPVDFFDPQTWIDGRLSPCVGRPLPPLSGVSKPTGIAGYINTVANALPGFPIPGRRGSKSTADLTKVTNVGGAAAPDTMNAGMQSSDLALAAGNVNNGQRDADGDSNEMSAARTAVTIPREEAIAYLTRTLASVKRFKEELVFNPAHDVANAYPPISVIYGKSTPTVVGAKVDGKDGIKHADCYDELAFASGDGVVLAKAAMAPEGYRTARGGIVSSERGHVTLLGDLEAVGRCLNAITQARRKGVGLGR